MWSISSAKIVPATPVPVLKFRNQIGPYLPMGAASPASVTSAPKNRSQSKRSLIVHARWIWNSQTSLSTMFAVPLLMSTSSTSTWNRRHLHHLHESGGSSHPKSINKGLARACSLKAQRTGWDMVRNRNSFLLFTSHQLC